VIAVDRQGNVDAEPAHLAFSVEQPWYRSAGFLVVASVALAAIVYLLCLAVYHYHLRGRLIRVAEDLRKTAEGASRAKSEFPG